MAIATPPSLLTLCLDALTRLPDDREKQNLQQRPLGSAGSFWSAHESSPSPIALSPLPLPVDLKQRSIKSLRVAGMLRDQALLRLTDVGFSTLCLASCRFVSGEALQLLPVLCPALVALDLSWCTQLQDDEVLSIMVLPALRALSLRGCWRVTEACVRQLLASIESLCILRIGDALPIDPISPLRPQQMLTGITMLECVGSSLSAAALAQLPSASSLRVLVLSDAPHLTDVHVAALLARCTQLASLDLRGCNAKLLGGGFLLRDSSASLTALRIDGTRLGHISAHAPPSVPSGGLTSSVRVPQALLGALSGALGRALSRLPDVSGSAIGAAEVEQQPTEASASSSSSSPTAAATLAATSASAAAAPPSGSSGVRFPSLTRLDLSGHRHLLPVFVRAVLRGMPSLVTLELSTNAIDKLGTQPPEHTAGAASSPTSDALIGTPLPRLRELRLSRTMLGVDCAADIVENCPALALLTCVRCDGFDAAFAAALRALQRLARLRLCDCACAEEERLLAMSILDQAVQVELQLPSTLGTTPRRFAGTPEEASVLHVAECARQLAWVPETVGVDPAAAALWDALSEPSKAARN